MRYGDTFDYKITVDDELDLNGTLIPLMLIQPFVENAIEHGFRNLSHKGCLNINFKAKNGYLLIEVDQYEGLLTPFGFLRCHQLYLVNFKYVKKYYRVGYLQMENKVNILVSSREKKKRC